MRGNLFKSLATVSAMTMASRVLGFVRQILISGIKDFTFGGSGQGAVEQVQLRFDFLCVAFALQVAPSLFVTDFTDKLTG